MKRIRITWNENVTSSFGSSGKNDRAYFAASFSAAFMELAKICPSYDFPWTVTVALKRGGVDEDSWTVE